MKKFLFVLMIALALAACAPTTSKEDSIIVGLECDYAPFNWTQLEATETSVRIEGNIGYCDGYDITVASTIATELGKTLIVKQIAWEGLEPALASGEIDMIVAGMTDTLERRQRVAFSVPYYASDMVMVVRKDSVFASATSLADFTGANVVAQRGTFHDGLVSQIPSVNHMTPLATFPLLVNAVMSLESDALVSENPVAISIVKNNPDLTIIRFTQANGFQTNFEDTTVSVALRQTDTELLESINAILSGISSEQRDTWMADAISRQPE
ncbi:MAG: transporter substrate-binding domain-containing protein [Erysipelothrix sp.]|jgi:ABC-type amino acid transport substrate-binding protein|nr:transporter substrate-binding domain-containing protein [Erysipelothrix sp.]